AAFSNDGKYLIAGGGIGTLHIWELADNAASIILKSTSEAALRAVSVARSGERIFLAAAQSDGTTGVRFRDVSQNVDNAWHSHLQLQTAPASTVAISPDCGQILVGCNDGHIRVF